MTQLIDLGKLRFNFAGDWNAATVYESNDVVKYGGNVYVYTYGLKTSGHLPTDIIYWALMIQGFKFRGVFDPSTAYLVGDGIAYGGKVYISILDSTGATPPNTTYWSQFVDGIQYEGTYSNTTAYQKNDVVVYGGSIYIAKVDTTAHDPTNLTYWDKFVEGVSPRSVYNTATAYVPGDLVAYGANLYRCTANTTGNAPTNTSYWTLFTSGLNPRGDWTTATSYGLNELVNYGGSSYVCLVTHASTVFATDLAAGKWQKFNSGIRYLGAWSASTTYLKDDFVQSGSSTYICTASTTVGGNAPYLGTNPDFTLLAAGAEGFVAKTGSAMTGPLILSGPPTLALQAATKAYVDGNAPTIAPDGKGCIGTISTHFDRTNQYNSGWGATHPITGQYFQHYNAYTGYSLSTAMNLVFGDGLSNYGSSERYMLGESDSLMPRTPQFANGNRVGQTLDIYHSQNNTSNTGGVIRLLPIRNNSASAITVSLAGATSNYWSSGYEGNCLWVMTPNAATYSGVTGVTSSLVSQALYSTSAYINILTGSISIPANTTVLVGLISTDYYLTTSRFWQTNFFYNLPTTFSDPNITCDMRMLSTLVTARLNIPYNSQTANDLAVIWTKTATLYGDR